MKNNWYMFDSITYNSCFNEIKLKDGGNSYLLLMDYNVVEKCLRSQSKSSGIQILQGPDQLFPGNR